MYPALVLLAVVFARHAPENERRHAFMLSVTLVANWLICGWTYAPAHPLHRMIGVSAPNVWAMADAVLAVAAIALTAGHRWWGWAIWIACTAQIGLHLTRNLIPDPVYIWWLDRLFDAQIATFIFLGGKGVKARVSFGMSRFLPFSRMGGDTRRVLATEKAA